MGTGITCRGEFIRRTTSLDMITKKATEVAPTKTTVGVNCINVTGITCRGEFTRHGTNLELTSTKATEVAPTNIKRQIAKSPLHQ